MSGPYGRCVAALRGFTITTRSVEAKRFQPPSARPTSTGAGGSGWRVKGGFVAVEPPPVERCTNARGRYAGFVVLPTGLGEVWLSGMQRSGLQLCSRQVNGDRSFDHIAHQVEIGDELDCFLRLPLA